MIEDDHGNVAQDFKSRLTEPLLFYAAPLLLLWSPFINYLVVDHNYPLYSLEALICIATLGMAALLVAVLWHLPSRLPYTAAVALLITIFIDREFSWMESTSKLTLAGLYVLLMCLLWKGGKKILAVLTAFLGAFLGTTLVMAMFSSSVSAVIRDRSANSVGKQLPRLIHLVLDEHVGVEAIPSDTNLGQQLKQSILDFYREFGFLLYGRTYSHYYETYDSLPNLLNFSLETTPRALVESIDAPHPLRKNNYFVWLEQHQYVVEVVSAGYLDYCKGPMIPAQRCKNYRFDALQSLNHLDMPSLTKVPVLLGAYMTRYHRYRRVLEVYEDHIFPKLTTLGVPAPKLPQDTLWTWNHLIPLSVSALAVLEEIWEDILTLPEGHALYIHLLLPHTPYVAREDCSFRLIQETKGLSLDHPDRHWSQEKRAGMYEDYLKQTVCLYAKLEQLFRKMRAAGMLDNSIVILHGDHGSRLGFRAPLKENLGQFTTRDFLDGFATLFAIKVPGESGGYNLEVQSLQHVFREWLARAINSPPMPPLLPDEGEPFVYFFAGEGKPYVRVPNASIDTHNIRP